MLYEINLNEPPPPPLPTSTQQSEPIREPQPSSSSRKQQQQQQQAARLLSESQIDVTLFLVVAQSSAADPDAEIGELYASIIEHVEELSRNYIWNNEKLHLSKPVPASSSSSSAAAGSLFYTCHGCIDFGDNLEDEWFIVSLLLKLSAAFRPRVLAQVLDADGEFLLIHAANHLPAWAASAADNCMSNRVFIYDGHVHIVPPAQTPAQITYLPAMWRPVEDALSGARCVRDFGEITRASPLIQQSIGKRVAMFDVADKRHLAAYHRASCLVPAKLAWVLKNNGGALIASAINRFCDKDAGDLKLCRTLDTFRPVDMVNYRVCFTKHLYGKLKYCDYKPERRHNWPSPSASDPTPTTQTQTQTTQTATSATTLSNRDRSMLGFKLTCAFEILFKRLLADKKMNMAAVAPAATSVDSVTSSPPPSKSFDAYVKRLKSIGYFKDYIEHSKAYNALMDKARHGYYTAHHLNTPTPTTTTTPTMLPTPPPPPQTKSNEMNEDVEMEVDDAVLLDSVYLDKLLDTEDDYVLKLTSDSEEADDSEEWLCVDAPQLDDYLEMYSRGEASSTYDFRLISNAFKKFMQRPGVDQGVDYESIERTAASKTRKSAKGGKQATAEQEEEEEAVKLVDLDVDAIEKKVREFFKETPLQQANKEEEEATDEDENDSFYEVGDEDDDGDDKNDDEEADKMESYMADMDAELKKNKELSRLGSAKMPAATKAAGKATSDATAATAEAMAAADEELSIDLNLVTNALESYSSQLGLTGPVSNILKSLGL